MKISIRTFDPSLGSTLRASAPAGVTVERPPVVGRKGLGYETAHEIMVLAAGIGKDVAVGVFASWLYDRLKKSSVQSVEIDGQRVGVSEPEIRAAIEVRVTRQF
jgi:hypothetical protein